MTTENHKTALLTEHFRQTPLSLLDEIINTVNELVFTAIDRLEEALHSASPDVLGYEVPAEAASLDATAYTSALTELKQEEISTGIVQLESLLNATVDKDFDKFEIYTLRNILAVGHEEDDLADWICLDHYKNLDSKNGQQISLETIKNQQRQRRETAKLNMMLKAEHARNAAMIEQIEAGLKQVNFLSSAGEISLGSVPETALSEIRTFLKEPQSKQTAPRINEARRAYINAEARKALEHG